MPPVDAGEPAPRRWGDDRALLDDDEARRRLLDATGRCIIRRGSAQIRMTEVADEAGVARSTVYRYFRTRDDLVLGLLLSRVDAALETVVRSLRDPDDAAKCLPDLILKPIGLVEGSPLNEALFSERSSAFITFLELSSEQLLDASLRHLGPLLDRWRLTGQLHADLDVRETVRWMNAVALILLSPPWRTRPRAAKRLFLTHYLVRALVPPGAT
ncbi:MAG: TetR/AcrR family transcriptional regulator [Gammaproteobacteria bacterium]|jgi:TetR/AcrR family transcriptional regulator